MNKLLDELVEIPFDLFSRNYVLMKIVDRIQEKKRKLRIIDIGGRNGLIYKFLPQHDIHIIDIREPDSNYEKTLARNSKYIIGDIQHNSLKANSFDLTISFDMLEHVSPDARINVLEEMLNTCTIGAVIGAPFNSHVTDEAEKAANDYYRQIAGEDHPWLKEHIDNKPLPDHRTMENYLNNKGYSFVKFFSNNIQLWTIMQHLIFSAYIFGFDISDIYRRYNEAVVLGKLHDGELPVYRFIYCIFKDSDYSATVHMDTEQQNSISSIEHLKLTSEIFCKMATIHKINALHASSWDSFKEGNSISAEALKTDYHTMTLSNRNEDNDLKIESLQRDFNRLQKELEQIYRSRGWKILNIYYLARDAILFRKNKLANKLFAPDSIIKKLLKRFLKNPAQFISEKYYVISNVIASRKISSRDLIIREIEGHITPKTKKRLCIFAHYDRDNIIDEYVIHFLRNINAIDCEILFVSTSESLQTDSVEKIKDFCVRIIIRKNISYDFGSWKTGLDSIDNIAQYKLATVATA